MKCSSLRLRMTAVAVLCLAAGTASANIETTFNINPTTGYGSFGAPEANKSGVSFSDIFNFTMPSSATGGSSSVISIISSGIDFTSVELMQGVRIIASGSGFGSVFLTGFKFEPGQNPYSVVVKGTTTVANSNAGYSGSIRVSPVPEPKTYAMMLAGIGLLAFTARRRRTNFF